MDDADRCGAPDLHKLLVKHYSSLKLPKEIKKAVVEFSCMPVHLLHRAKGSEEAADLAQGDEEADVGPQVAGAARRTRQAMAWCKE